MANTGSSGAGQETGDRGKAGAADMGSHPLLIVMKGALLASGPRDEDGGVPCSHCATECRRAAGADRADGVILNTGNRPLHTNSSPSTGTGQLGEREWISTPTLNSRSGS